MKARACLSTRRVGFSPPARGTSSAHAASKTSNESRRESAQFIPDRTRNLLFTVRATRTGRLKPTLRVVWRLRWILAAFIILFAQAEALADGGTVRLVEVSGGYQISVFTSPTPCRAGTVDVSVMVQDAKSGRVLPDARVALIVAPANRPSRARRYQASAAAATNKLLQAALVEVPTSGAWKIAVKIDGPQGPASVQCEIEVGPALPRWEALWGWIAWPGLVIALFALRVCVQPERRGGSQL